MEFDFDLWKIVCGLRFYADIKTLSQINFVRVRLSANEVLIAIKQTPQIFPRIPRPLIL